MTLDADSAATLVPNTDERALAEAVRAVLADLAGSEQLRADAETEQGFGEAAWKTLAREVGLCGLTIPEEHGGLGLGFSAANVVHHELGRRLYSGPFLATALAGTALIASPYDGANSWLHAIASGDSIATVAFAGRSGTWTGADVAAVQSDRGWTLTGRRWFVIAGHVADVIVVLARTPDGDALFVVDNPLESLSRTGMPGLDLTRRLAVIDLADTPAVLIAAPGPAGDVLAAVDRHLRLAVAAEAAGGLSWCLDTCVEYASTRRQFGRVIGSYQAVAHACVELLNDRNSCTAAARWAAVAAENAMPDAELAGHVAALRAGEAYKVQTEAAVHLLGGIGFTWEHDMHLHYRRARSAAALAGGAAAHRSAIAQLAGL